MRGFFFSCCEKHLLNIQVNRVLYSNSQDLPKSRQKIFCSNCDCAHFFSSCDINIIFFLLDKIMEKKFKDFFCNKVEFDTKEFFHALPADVHFMQPKVSKIECYSTKSSFSTLWNQNQRGFLWKIWICGNILIGQWFCGMDIRYLIVYPDISKISYSNEDL